MTFARRSAVPLPLAALIGAVSLWSAACTIDIGTHGYRDVETNEWRVEGRPDLTLDTFDGSVEVRSWDAPVVVVEVEKRGSTRELAKNIEVETEQDGRRIRVRVRRPEGGEGIAVFTGQRSARIVAKIPREADLTVRSGDGSVTIEGVRGRLELRTGDGSVRGFDLEGDLAVDTGDGSVVLKSVAGRVEVHTGDGGVEIMGHPDRLTVRSGDGAIRVSLAGDVQMSGSWSIETADGGIALDLPPGFAAQLDARTGDGAIRVDRDFLEGMMIDEEGGSAQGTLGGGGPLLKVRTGDGTISVRR